MCERDRAQGLDSRTSFALADSAIAIDAGEIHERSLRLLFQNSAVGMFIATPEFVITYANRAFLEFLGYAEGELSGTQLDRLCDPADRQLLSLSVGTVHPRDTRQERRFTCKSGEKVWGVISPTWIVGDDGEPLLAVVMVQDVTRRKRLEQELFRDEKLASLGLLAGGIAHEFNNILTVILGNVSLAAVMSEGNDELNDVLKRSARAGVRARELTSRLITFAKGGDPVKKLTPVPRLLRESASLGAAGCRGVVRFEIQPSLPDVELDPTQMVQAFANLIRNAVEASPVHGPVTVAAHEVLLDASNGLLPAGRYVRVTIRDDGVGISPVDLGCIFDPFFSTKNSTGLGLATAHSVVKQHGGHLSVTSEVGVGSTFTVYLPVAGRDDAAAVLQTAPPVRRGRVLVLEDQPEVGQVVVAMLTACGMEADVVSNGGMALSKFEAAVQAGRAYAAVILDLTVPGGLGGAEIVGRLRELDPEVRAIVSSGYSASPVLADFRRYGFAGVLSKPYTMAELRQTLGVVLAR